MQLSTLLSSILLFVSLVIPVLSMSPATIPKGILNWIYPPLSFDVKVVHQFPAGTWIENLAVRKNGKILVTALSSPQLRQVDNRGRKPVKLIHAFNNATSCTGITQMEKDVFYVITGNFSLSTFRAVPGSWSVYKVDIHHHHPQIIRPRPTRVSLVANFPDSIMLNGITVLSRHKQWLLVSDSGAGVVYRLETQTGMIDKVLDDPLMKPGSSAFGNATNGINGIRTKRGELFFTNHHQNILARIPIDHRGTSKSDAKVVARIDGVDDFVFDRFADAIAVQNGADRLVRVDGDTTVTLAGGPLDETLPTQGQLYGPTAVRFGKVKSIFRISRADWMLAYITTNGGSAQYLDGNITRGGTVSAVDVRGNW
ncbi:hypothetical protein MMC07_003724 [Pseudocyphellaria aurata]|nr:hypothetical protein [Pseudocyphellaria aurata]